MPFDGDRHDDEAGPVRGRSSPRQLGPRRRAGDPVGVRAGAGVARRRSPPRALRALHQRPRGRRERRRDLRDGQPGHRGTPRQGRPGDRCRRRPGRPGRPPRGAALMGQPRSARAREVPLPHRPHPPGALARVRGARDDGLRQADQGIARRRRAPRGGPLLVLRGLGRQARVRVPRPGRAPARRGRPDHPVELPAPHAGLEDRTRPRGREHGRPQARLDHPPVGPPVRRGLPPGRPAARRRQHHPRAGRDRHGPGHASRASTRSPSPARPRSARRSRRASPAPTRR